MRRGDIWTVAGAGYGAKPRPAVIISSDAIPTDSVTVVLFTSHYADAPLLRLEVEADEENRLGKDTSWLMVDKIISVPRTKLGRRVGVLAEHHLRQLTPMITLFLGLG